MTGAELIADKTPGSPAEALAKAGRYQEKEHYLRVHLAKPVPENGEGRVRIDKTYFDPKSYFTRPCRRAAIPG